MNIYFNNLKNKIGIIVNHKYFLVGLLMVVCSIGVIWVLHDVRSAYSGGMRMRRSHYGGIKTAGPVTVDSIQPWMTFDYINFIFRLPPDYLKSSLNINDPHYPNIQIGRYAKITHQKSDTLVNEIKNAIRKYNNN